MNSSHQRINQTTGNFEHYSPSWLIEAARLTMGGIDVDGASSEKANSIVQAGIFFSKPTMLYQGELGGLPAYAMSDRGGLEFEWYGRLWLNHPFGIPMRACNKSCKKKTCRDRGYHIVTDVPGNGDWINHLIRNYEVGNITQACVLTYAVTSETWYKPLKRYPQCFMDGRTGYVNPETMIESTGNTKGSSVTYLGPNVMAFAENFSPFGEVKAVVDPNPDMLAAFASEYGEPGDFMDQEQYHEIFKIWRAAWRAAYGQRV